MMRRYSTSTSQEKAESISENSERWGNYMKDSDDETSFSLKTPSGVLSYKSNDNNSYTDFLRVSITMLLAFNSNEIDPELKKVMNLALQAYENGDTLTTEFDPDDDEEADFVAMAFANAKSESDKFDVATKFASNLAKADNYKLQILSLESEDASNIERILGRQTDLPPPVLHDAINNQKPFVLPADKAKEAYVQLRMLDVFVNIKPVSDENSETKEKDTTIKKSAAKKVTSKKTSTNKKSAKRTVNCKTDVNGSEKLSRSSGIITNFEGNNAD